MLIASVETKIPVIVKISFFRRRNVAETREKNLARCINIDQTLLIFHRKIKKKLSN